ncbi:MAG TPA: hypothetical protein VEF89_24590 [Solirubrobacteraceae bacterium]|nr:hypothetical protein [Solirubrobacteraceae bacterium]
MHSQDRARWIALIVICLGSLMNVLDSTVVGVALLRAGRARAPKPAAVPRAAKPAVAEA